MFRVRNGDVSAKLYAHWTLVRFAVFAFWLDGAEFFILSDSEGSGSSSHPHIQLEASSGEQFEALWCKLLFPQNIAKQLNLS